MFFQNASSVDTMKVLLLAVIIFIAVPEVEADAGDFHKWAVIVGTLLGSITMLAILCFIVYYVFVKQWLDDYLSDPTHRQDAIYHSQSTNDAPQRPDKVNMWNSGVPNGVVPIAETKRYSYPGYDQYYGAGVYQASPQMGDSQLQQPLHSSVPSLHYQQAYQQAVNQSYSGEPSVGAQIAAHNNQFGMPPTSTMVAQNTYYTSTDRPHQSVNAYRGATSTTQRSQVLSPAYTGSSV